MQASKPSLMVAKHTFQLSASEVGFLYLIAICLLSCIHRLSWLTRCEDKLTEAS
jgi:hypothetical protein